MGKRDRRRSRERRRARRQGVTFRRRPVKLKLVRPPLLGLDEIKPRLMDIIREGARLERERLAAPKQFEYGEGILDVNEYMDWISLVPDEHARG